MFVHTLDPLRFLNFVRRNFQWSTGLLPLPSWVRNRRGGWGGGREGGKYFRGTGNPYVLKLKFWYPMYTGNLLSQYLEGILSGSWIMSFPEVIQWHRHQQKARNIIMIHASWTKYSSITPLRAAMSFAMRGR